MSIYFVKGNGWRYDFMLQGARYTETWFGTKAEAKQAEAKKREEVQKPQPQLQTPTDITFLEFLNRRLDHVKAYKSDRYYTDYTYHVKRWVKAWGALGWQEISTEMVEAFPRKRPAGGSAHAENKDLRDLKAVFGFGVERRWIDKNPCQGIEFFPVTKNVKYVPPEEHIARVIASAKPNDVDYLVTIKDTMARVGEINQLTWNDVRFEERCVLLYTKKKGRQSYTAESDDDREAVSATRAPLPAAGPRETACVLAPALGQEETMLD